MLTRLVGKGNVLFAKNWQETKSPPLNLIVGEDCSPLLLLLSGLHLLLLRRFSSIQEHLLPLLLPRFLSRIHCQLVWLIANHLNELPSSCQVPDKLRLTPTPRAATFAESPFCL